MKLRPLLRRRLAIPVLCYLVALVAWILWGAAALGSDLLARNSGRLAEQTLHAGDFALVDLELQESALQEGEPETLLTLTGDPQMILEDVSDRTVRTLQVFAEYEGDAREMCLYYTTEAGQPYSQDRRVYPALQADGSYLYTLPRTRTVALRLDPCSPDEGKQVYGAQEGCPRPFPPFLVQGCNIRPVPATYRQTAGGERRAGGGRTVCNLSGRSVPLPLQPDP